MLGLKYFIQNGDLTQNEIANIMKVSPSAITKWMLNINELPEDRVNKLSELLHVEKEILTEDLDHIIINYQNEKYNALCNSIKRSKLYQLKCKRNLIDQQIKELSEV